MSLLLKVTIQVALGVRVQFHTNTDSELSNLLLRANQSVKDIPFYFLLN